MGTDSSRITKKIELKPILRIRVRCKEAHTDPWLRRLYVVWAAPVKPPEGDAKPDSPKFALAQSDESGYLSPVKTTLDPSPDTTMAMFPDIKYLMYFVRWPDSEFPEKVLGDLADFESGKKKWGDPKEMAPVFKAAGKSKTGAPIQEGIIEIEEDPAAFIQRGSDFYGGWTLFRNMPGTGSNNTDKDIQCPPLKKQVRRLQYHLGALRYPIGNQWHPYSPEPFTPRNGLQLLYPNEAVFEIVTWNCVLGFQRDARRGLAQELNPGARRTATLESESFEPTDAAEDWQTEIRESTAYMTNTPADRSKAFADIPGDCDTVVEETTAQAIKKWLTNKLRKPGKILVAGSGQYDSWMQEDALSPIQALNADLKRLGAASPGQFNNALRDVRMSVLKPGPGQIINSIHKSGFAFDFAMDNFVGPRDDFPLYFVKDATDPKKIYWTVYAPVKTSDVPDQFRRGSTKLPDPKDGYVEYVDSITPWLYEPDDSNGGQVGGPLQIDGSVFLNFTKVCEHGGFARIPAHGEWAGSGDTNSFQLGTSDEFAKFVGALSGALSFAISSLLVGKSIKVVKRPRRQTNLPNATIDGVEYDLESLADLGVYLALWLRAAQRLGATPDVELIPGTKEGDGLIQLLRGKDFKGRKVQIFVFGEWEGGEGASNLSSQPPDNATSGQMTTADLLLGPKTEFPKKLSFVLRPVTEPVALAPGSTIQFPKFGTPAGMEWWHYQYTKGFDGQDWKTILGLIGWTEEGLLGKAGGKPVKGLYGLGYLKDKHLDHKAG